MAPAHQLAARDEVVLTTTTIDLLITLLVLALVGLACVLALLILRRYRRSKNAAGLPGHNKKKVNHRRLAVTASPDGRHSKSIFVYNDKQELLDSSLSPPQSPLPEIRITFPEEVDDSGKRQSGRVVVVHVGDKGDLGLEPVDEHLPTYQQSASDRFHSLDLERIGGLKEKDSSN